MMPSGIQLLLYTLLSILKSVTTCSQNDCSPSIMSKFQEERLRQEGKNAMYKLKLSLLRAFWNAYLVILLIPHHSLSARET
jgi:hypothetical protein